MHEAVSTFADTSWTEGGPGPDAAPTRGVEAVLEAGGVLAFPQLPFVLEAAEQRFLDTRFADGRAKNISLRGPDARLKGAVGTVDEQAALRAMVMRFSNRSAALLARLFPHYRGRLTPGNASFRPMPVAGRESSWRQDDTRLHIDAFPSNPIHGTRLLRVFTNLNPHGQPREWRVGEPFENFVRRFLPGVRPPLPGSAALLAALHVTKRRRSAYDHYMLALHDRAKADLAWQRESPQQHVHFAPGTTWVVFSDQVLHAVMGGQFMLEHTFYLQPQHQVRAETAPLAVLERLLGRPLLA